MAFEWDLRMGVLTEYDADGFLGVSHDGYGNNSGVSPAEVHHPHGFYSRPLDAQKDEHGKVGVGCNVWWVWEGSTGHAVVASDPRVVPDLPALKQGESMIYGAAHNFVRCQDDGTVSTYCTSDGTTTGQSIYSAIGPNGGIISAPWGKETFDKNGYHLRTFSGARLDIGGIAGLPFPLDQLGSYAQLSAGTIKLQGAMIALGPDTGAAEAVVKGTTLVAYLTALEAAIVVMMGAIAPKPPAGPVLATDVVAALVVFGNAIADILTPLKLAMQSSSTTVT